MMMDYDIVQRYIGLEKQINAAGYTITSSSGFFIRNKQNQIVAQVASVDGLYGFLQAIEYCGVKE